MRKSRRSGAPTALAAILLTVALGASWAQGSLRFQTVTLRQNRPGYWKASAAYPQFRGDLAIVKPANRALKAEAESRMKQFVRQCREQFQKLGKPTAPYEYLGKPAISLARPTFISAYVTNFEYTGGAHGNTYFSVCNLAFVGGKPRRVGLGDLFRPGVNGAEVSTGLIMAKLKSNPRAAFVRDGSVKSIGAELASDLIVSPGAITFLLPPYAIAPYSEGSFFVTLRGE